MYYFIVNTKSRTGKADGIWKTLEAYLTQEKVLYKSYITEYEGHAKLLASELSKMSMEEITIVVVGGDGTVNEVINGIEDFSKIRFGYIPLGSGNDLARGLGVSGEPLEILKRILTSNTVQAMDLGYACYGDDKKKYFSISSGVGIDAFVCKEALHSKLKKFLNAIHLGSLTYLCLTVKSLFTMPTTNAKVIFDDGRIRHLNKTIFIVGMNHRAEGGGVPMAPRASAFDGKLSVCLVHGIPRWKTFFLLPILVAGKHEKRNGFEVVNCKSCEIQLEQELVLHTDGEYCGMRKAIWLCCEPGLLRLIC